MKKWIVILALTMLCMASSMTACAKSTEKTVVALGADLNTEQRAKVLELLGLTEETLSECTVIYTTNAQEHEYLDAYMEASVIGTKALSSVMIKAGESGSGVLVNTQNINYCTTGMYRNALLTAGLEDSEVTVVAPSPTSGSAALIGAIKAYEELAGTTISDSVLDTAMDEMITTGEIASSTASNSSDDVEDLIAYIKGKLATGDLKDENDIKDAILEAEEKFDVSLTGDEVQKIIDVMNKIDKLGLNLESLTSQAQDLYDKFGMDIVNHPDEAITYVVKQKVNSFFTGITDKIKNFFGGLFQ